MTSISHWLIAALLASRFTPLCPPNPPSPGAIVWFDFQVERAAAFEASAASRPYPDPALAPLRSDTSRFALVQFIVDTTGVPRPTSLKYLRRPAGLDTTAVRRAFATWRYTPARVQGCVVPQLVMTPLHWGTP